MWVRENGAGKYAGIYRLQAVILYRAPCTLATLLPTITELQKYLTRTSNPSGARRSEAVGGRQVRYFSGLDLREFTEVSSTYRATSVASEPQRYGMRRPVVRRTRVGFIDTGALRVIHCPEIESY